MKMNTIFGDAKDKYVAAVVLYGHTDNFLYFDEKHTAGNTINHDELLDLAMKGLVVVATTDGFFHPISFKDNTTDVQVVVVTNVGASDSASATYKSKERAEA